VIRCAYNAINGIPACGNDLYMNRVARQAWGFSGYMVSDCGAISDGAFGQYINVSAADEPSAPCLQLLAALPRPHAPLPPPLNPQDKYNGSTDQQVRVGIQGGCDAECGNFYGVHGVSAVSSGVLPESDVDQAFVRLWTAAFEYGYLGVPTDLDQLGPKDVDTPEHRRLAKEGAEQAMVLLKNQGGVLPLAADVPVAVIGPHSESTGDMLSNYVGINNIVNDHSPLKVSAAAVGEGGEGPVVNRLNVVWFVRASRGEG
jgi:beta-glucosidase-like glycosyl hydrolase